MNLLIVGCGRVGSNLASQMCEKGHDVSVIDRKKASFELLDEKFSGLTFTGVPIDNEVLQSAGIADCDAVCAVTEDDDVNIMVSEIAKNAYNIPMVITRILNPEKEDVFQEYGLNSVCPTRLTVDAVLSVIEGCKDERYLRFGNHTVKFYEMPAIKDYFGIKCFDIEFEEYEILYAIINAGGKFTLVNNNNITINEGDTLVFSKLVD